MPSLDQLQASQVIKLLMIGDSGTGKTGGHASLAGAGYDIFLMDFDNGWESLANAIKKFCPERLSSVQVESLRDKWKSSAAGPILDGLPQAFMRGVALLDKWGEFGAPKDWGPKKILVIDSLTFMADAAFNWAKSMNPGAKDQRQIYGAAQDAVEHVLAYITGKDFNTNVIVTSHIRFIDLPDGSKRGYPTSIGQALSPTIPRYFNSVVQTMTRPGGARTVQTVSTALIDLKNPASFAMAKELPIETGLATFFSTVKGPIK